MIIQQDSSGQTVELRVGEVLQLRLAENPTTGYRWSFASDGAPSCVVVGDHFERSAARPGAGGQHTWQIKGIAVGVCDITMQYRRHFQPDAAAENFALHVRVTQSG